MWDPISFVFLEHPFNFGVFKETEREFDFNFSYACFCLRSDTFVVDVVSAAAAVVIVVVVIVVVVVVVLVAVSAVVSAVVFTWQPESGFQDMILFAFFSKIF